MPLSELQYIADANGTIQSVVVPIEIGKKIESERETAYLLNSETMKRRLLESINRDENFTLSDFENAIYKLETMIPDEFKPKSGADYNIAHPFNGESLMKLKG